MINLEENNTEDLFETDNSYWSERKQALDSLNNKPFFKTLVKEGYFKDYVFELVMELVQGEEGRRSIILEKLVGIAKLQDYLHMVEALSSTEEGHMTIEYEKELEGRNRVVAMNSALEEAEKDADFKLLVMDGYLTDHALNQTSLITNESIIVGGHRKDVLEELSGISVLRNYLVDVHKDVVDLAYEDDDDESEE